MRRVRRGACLQRAGSVLVCLLSTTSLSFGQQSRAEEHAAKQAEKATEVRPHEANVAERVIDTLDRIGLLGVPIGFHPWFGSVLAGGSFAGGPAVRLPYSDTGVLNAYVGWSLRNYKVVDARATLPGILDRRMRVEVAGRWVDAPSVAFFGLGPDSSKRTRARFGYRPGSVGVIARTSPTSWLGIGAGLDRLGVQTSQGGGRHPSINELFDDEDAPGLGRDATYTVGRLFAEADRRQSPGYTTSGGFYRVEWAHYAQREDEGFSFRRLDAEVDQFIPLLRANWVIALRAVVSMTDVDVGHQVPFFLMPSLGGGDELRGFPEFRFRDRHRMLLTGEYRWTPSRFLDMALFYEAGKVASRRSDLRLTRLQRSYGIGAHFHAPSATALRVELASTGEGLRFIFGYGPVF